MNIDPTHMEVLDWAETTLLPLQKFTPAPALLTDPDKWQEWAYGVVTNATISRFNPPDPRRFDDWRDWAYHFNQAVPL